MADRNFLHLGDPPEQRQVDEIEIVSRVHTESDRRCVRGRASERRAALLRCVAVHAMCPHGFRKGAGVQLDAFDADRGGPIDLLRTGSMNRLTRAPHA